MIPWETLASATAPDDTSLELRRRGDEYRIRAGAHELMSSRDEASSRSLSELGCAHLQPAAHVLVGGLGMGFTLRAALDLVGDGIVEICELVPAVVEWNQGELGPLAGHPLRDPRTRLTVGDVGASIRGAESRYDAILLDVDNGPIALAHSDNHALYSSRGIAAAWRALKPEGVLAVWSLLDDERFTKRLKQHGFDARAHLVPGAHDRGREHVIWVARKLGRDRPRTRSRR